MLKGPFPKAFTRLPKKKKTVHAPLKCFMYLNFKFFYLSDIKAVSLMCKCVYMCVCNTLD